MFILFLLFFFLIFVLSSSCSSSSSALSAFLLFGSSTSSSSSSSSSERLSSFGQRFYLNFWLLLPFCSSLSQTRSVRPLLWKKKSKEFDSASIYFISLGKMWGGGGRVDIDKNHPTWSSSQTLFSLLAFSNFSSIPLFPLPSSLNCMNNWYRME